MASALESAIAACPPVAQQMYLIGTCYKCQRKLTERELVRCIEAQVLRCCSDDWETMAAEVTAFSEKFIELQERLK